MTDKQTHTPPSDRGDRIAKALARAGVGSRRDVETMIQDGRVAIDGTPVKTPATFITTLDGITVDGQPVAAVERTRLWRLNKRRGQLTTHKDPEGRRTVFDSLPAHMGRVVSVGRLDMSTEGLLLLTNDGALARWLELPKHGHVRRYRVRVHGTVEPRRLDALKDGITIDGVQYDSIIATLDQQTGANAWLSVAITEGKNREVRRVMEHLGLSVNRLIRVAYGPFTLGKLPPGAVSEVPTAQLVDLIGTYFEDAPKPVVADTPRLTPSKWAKAKKRPTKPGDRRRAARPKNAGPKSAVPKGEKAADKHPKDGKKQGRSRP
ncbi:pseudouridine synthase [Yunchengibacter salinarum]|uniref:pseudouridine synthase n=1 Tax=Yunchengibacter salinarum TaxID=3133399 RepID=UPI0035B5CDFB